MAEMTNEQLARALDAAIAVIDPLLDVLAERDPLGLKAHTFDEGDHSGIAAVQHTVAKALDVADWPGTKGWTELSMKDRADWWISRLGTVNTIAVAYPGALGAWAKVLPLATPLGFANQATVLVAIAREYGVTDRAWQIRLLASVLCDRDLPDDALPASVTPVGPENPTSKRSALRLLWDIAQILRKVDAQMSRRPQPPRPFSTLSWVPLLGAPSLYIGERLALCRAIRSGREWIVAHPESLDVSRPRPAGSPRPRA
ncbi:hypothetical protein [Gordonia sp. i37]|uniref:hypothetical protein n=1 Tax=Gordonia sp. i37 TaxID=1961707 RepID=UPI0009ADDC9C|nr:hypothetical protein [Gordonia sp. i37]OPX09570.1 hypothetical protein B1964_24765 [Gordonia sp. i37]